MLSEPASSLTDLLLAAVGAWCALWLRSRKGLTPHWWRTLAWTAAAAFAGAVHHGFATASDRWTDPSWAVVTFLVVVAISYLLAAAVDEVLGPGRARAFWVLRSASLLAYVVVAATIGASIGAILLSEGVTMLAVLALWVIGLRRRHPRAPAVIVALVASMVAAVIRAAPADLVAPTGLDPTSLYHLAQIPGLVLLARAAAASNARTMPDTPTICAMAQRILVVDDEQSIRTIVEYALKDAGFDVVTAARGDDALAAMERDAVDLVVLDVMLPGMDGLEVCQRIRAERNVPIIMLSARGEELDKVLGLELGADDYVTKPFSPRELVSRVKANLRRGRMDGEHEDSLRFGDLEIDPVARAVTRADEDITLTLSEFEILLKLARSPRRVFTRQELMDHLWKGTFYGDLRSVDVHVRHLRQKIERDASNPQLIRTVRGVGYAFGGEDGAGV